MDHLKSSQERRDRWYARHILPNYIPTNRADEWDDLWKESSCYDSVKSLPFEWLCDSNGGNLSMPISMKILNAMEHHGFLVVSGVLEESECDEAMSAAWDWMEAASDAELQLDNNSSEEDVLPVQRQDLTTLGSVYFPRSVEGGMMPFYGAGHSKFAWLVRSNPKVKRVFEAFHEEDNLLASLDGVVLWRGGSEASSCGDCKCY